jgi:hypothetical protein
MTEKQGDDELHHSTAGTLTAVESINCALPLHPSDATVPTPDGAPHGDEVDNRMSEIKEILGYAAMPLLNKCELVREWVHCVEARLCVSGQLDRKRRGGRPEGGVMRAARELRVPGRTPEARRMFIKRAIKIHGIWPEAKQAARAAGVDDVQSALLAVATEHSPESQLKKVQELRDRKALPRRKKKAADSKHDTRVTNPERQTNDGALNESTAPETLSGEQESGLAALKASWTEAGILKREHWEKLYGVVQRRFVRDILLIDEIAS